MGLRQQHAALIADYLSKGGRIRKLPPPRPTTPSDVLRYLQDNDVDVRAAPDNDRREPQFVYKRKLLSFKALVGLANRHRVKRRLPPFQIASNVH